ncbi:MAG: hypothetical protein IIZ94_07795 [Prevotella sp.]|nr:hypothetical protein [Prevotella sp.]
MFQGCTSLTKSPEICATSIGNWTFDWMFYGCSNLSEIKFHYNGTLSSTYSGDWVNGVAATGIFYYNGSQTARGTSAIPTGWTITPFTA